MYGELTKNLADSLRPIFTFFFFFFLGLLFLVDAFGVGHDLALHVGEDAHEASSRGDNGSHEIFDGHSPWINAWREVGAERGYEADVLTRKDESHVRSQSEQRIVFLRLVHRRDLVREAPEQQTRHDAPPHLGHDVEEREAPIPHDRQRRPESLRERQRDFVHERVGVQRAHVGEDDEGEGGEEAEEGDGAGVEDVLLFHSVAELAVEGGESDRGREIDIRLDEGNDLRARPFGGHHQHVLRIAQNGVVE